MGFLGSIGQILGLGGNKPPKPQVVVPPGNQAALDLLQQNSEPLLSSLAGINSNILQSVLGYGENVALNFQDYMNNMNAASQQGLAGLIDNYQNAFGQNLSNWNGTLVSNIDNQANNVNNTISDYYKYNQQHLTDVYGSTLNNYNQFLNGVWGLAKQNEGQGYDRLNPFMTGIWDLVKQNEGQSYDRLDNALNSSLNLAKQNEQQGYDRLDSALGKSIGIANDIANNTQFRDQIKGDYTNLLNKSQDVYNSEFRKSSGNLAALGMDNTSALQQTQSDLINKLQYDVLGKETGALNAEDMLREKTSGDTLSALAQQYPQLMAKLASDYSGQQTNLLNTGINDKTNLMNTNLQTQANLMNTGIQATNNLINTNLQTQSNLMNTGMQTEANLYGQQAGALSASDTLYGNLGVNAATHQEDLINQAYTNQMNAGTNFLNNFYNNSLNDQSNLLNHYFQDSTQFEANLPTLAGQYATALTQATPQQQEWNSYIQLANAMNGINSAVTNTQGGGSSFGNALGTVGGLALGNSLFGGSGSAAGSGLGLSNLAGNVGSVVSSVGDAIGSAASWVGGLLGESTSKDTVTSNSLDTSSYDTNNTTGQALGNLTSNANSYNLNSLQQFLADARSVSNNGLGNFNNSLLGSLNSSSFNPKIMSDNPDILQRYGQAFGNNSLLALVGSLFNSKIMSGNPGILQRNGQALGSLTSNSNSGNLSSNNPYVKLFNSTALAKYPTDLLSKIFTPKVLDMMAQGLDLGKIAPQINGGDLRFINDRGYELKTILKDAGY
jgi:hypothetical protein